MQDVLFEKLVIEHGKAVLNTALRITGDVNTAQDVHQDVFLAIWRLRNNFNGQTNWGAYLYRTTIRKALEYARRVRFVPLDERQQSQKSQAGPDAAMNTCELWKKLLVCLSHLPQKQSEVFILARIEGLGYEKIAGILQCSQENVRTSLHRALKRLARELNDYGKQAREL